MGISSSCCIMIDGKVIAAQQEERFTRIKNYDTWPKHAIKSCLEIANVKLRDIDKVVWAGEDPPEMDYFLIKRYSSFSFKEMVEEQYKYWYPKIYKNKKVDYLKLFKNKIDLNQAPGNKLLNKYLSFNKIEKKKFINQFKEIIVTKELGISKDKIEYIEHHECHAFYSISNIINKKTKLLIFTIDGSGDRGINSTVSIYKNNKLSRIFESKKFIVGRIYRHITLLLGMKWGEHEYKTMGLAPYANYKDVNKVFDVFDKSFIIDFKTSNFLRKTIKDCYFTFLEKLRNFRFDNIAGGLQIFAERKILKWINFWLNKTKIYNISYSGGVSMNVKVNQEISKIKKIKFFDVPGSGTDESLSIGACFAYMNKQKIKVKSLENLYLGYQVNTNEILSVLKKLNRKKYKIKKNPSNKLIANLLKDGLILGRCVGKMEFGARALGNRSILADPRSYETIKKINKKIKSRDFWMPFAPSVIDKYAKNYFSIKKNVNYTQMTVCVDTKENSKKLIPSVLHPSDSTARIHMVKKKNNPDYYNLIKCFHKITKIGVLLNTSLNLHGKPIARTAKDCVEILENSDIDGIQIENYLILKK